MRNLELFQGVYPFVVTPMHARSQNVDGNRLRSHIGDLVEQGGVHGITVLGSTGEFASSPRTNGGRSPRWRLMPPQSAFPSWSGPAPSPPVPRWR